MSKKLQEIRRELLHVIESLQSRIASIETLLKAPEEPEIVPVAPTVSRPVAGEPIADEVPESLYEGAAYFDSVYFVLAHGEDMDTGWFAVFSCSPSLDATPLCYLPASKVPEKARNNGRLNREILRNGG